MYYFKHPIYGYFEASNPPHKNLDQYTEITKEEYIEHEMSKNLENKSTEGE